jgi:hypothetical protein
MKTDRLWQFLAIKYKVAEDASHLEASLRNKIDALYNVVHKSHSILEWCANSDVKKAESDREVQARKGFEFCRKVVNIVDYLKANRNDISFADITDALLALTNVIDENKVVEGSNVQFANVSELIFTGFPTATKYDRKIRDDQFGKMRTGLSRLMSIALDMVKDLEKLDPHEPEETDPIAADPTRFKPQRVPLSVYNIIDFIRQHGSEFGIEDRDDWGLVMENNPELKEKMSHIINMSTRGGIPKNDPWILDVKNEITKTLQNMKRF